MGEPSHVSQAWTALAPFEAAMRLQFNDGVCASNRIRTEDTNLSSRLATSSRRVLDRREWEAEQHKTQQHSHELKYTININTYENRHKNTETQPANVNKLYIYKY